MPEIKKVLESDFDGQAISKCNLTEWKQGGFVDWRAQQETMALAQEFMADGSKFGEVSTEVIQGFEAVTMAHYAATLHRFNRDAAEDPKARLRRLSKSLRDVMRLRRCEQARERMGIQREWLELERRKYEERDHYTSKATEPLADSNEIQPMTEEEKTEMLRELLMPKDEDVPPPDKV